MDQNLLDQHTKWEINRIKINCLLDSLLVALALLLLIAIGKSLLYPAQFKENVFHKIPCSESCLVSEPSVEESLPSAPHPVP